MGIQTLTLIATFIFLIAPVFTIIYIVIYNNRKKRFIQEKRQLELTFVTELTKTQLEVQEQTLQTIGAELHDNIGQLMSLTSQTLQSIELDNETKARQKIDESIGLTVRSIKELRLLGRLLEGDRLMAGGLVDAIRQLVGWMERSERYNIIYTAGDEIPANGNADKDLIIFRISQEIFNNIAKHAAATQIIVDLDYGEGMLKLRISDNGVGFAADEASPGSHGMGLHNIRKRAGIIGGETNINSDQGKGTQIIISVPYP
ncbi:MAG TPA: ATP-binding protein [Mucilaginibacter sp.]|jgi:signal transduction histidine kinase|nr:ATP-binding protein [Mucilaginibacter sp.]